MLEKLRNLYPKSRIAVIGSAPSALLFRDTGYDATIAVNGASKLLPHVVGKKYFLSGDAGACMQSWYRAIPREAVQILRPMAAIYSPVIISDLAQRTKLIRVWESYLNNHPEEVRVIPNRIIFNGSRHTPLQDLEYNNPFYEELLNKIPHCGSHVVFNVHLPQPISKSMKNLRRGPTSAGCALQVAYIMGATTIHMYGVEMTNQGVPYAEGNYFYSPKPWEKGVTTFDQLMSIEGVIDDLTKLGVRIEHFGRTRIRNVTVVEQDNMSNR